MAKFTEGIDCASLQTWLASTDDDSHPDEIYDLISTLAEVSPATAIGAFNACVPHLRRCLEQDLPDAAHGIAGWSFGTMYLVAHLAEAPGTMDTDRDSDLADVTDEPANDVWATYEPVLRELAAKTLTALESVDWEKAATSLAGKERHEIEPLDLFLFWLGCLSLDIVDRLAETFPDEWLDQLVTADADHTGSAGSAGAATIESIAGLLSAMSAGSLGSNKVRRLIERHEASLASFPFLLIDRFPGIAARMVNASRSVRLQSPRGGSWEPCTTALQTLAEADRDSAIRVLAASTSELREALEKPQAHDMKGLAEFIETTDDLDEGVLDALIAGLNVEVAGQWWRERLTDAGDELAIVLSRAAKVKGKVGDLARSLLLAP